MAIYTGVADANGDFTVPFSSSYNSGQKVTVTAEKDSATKSIELYAPSTVIGGGVIQFSGNLSNFPNNIGDVSLTGISGVINSYAFYFGDNSSIWAKSTGLIIDDGITTINGSAFYGWRSANKLVLPETLETIGSFTFYNWISLSDLEVPDSVHTINDSAFYACGASTVKLPNNINYKTVQSTCFMNAKFTEISIPNSVLTIENSSLRGMTSCAKIDLGSGITSIKTAALAGNTSCMELICRAVNPPSLASGSIVINSAGIIKVPAESVAAYQTAPNWSAYADKITSI